MQLYDNKYIFIKDLGNGGFGKVFLAKERVSNRFVAIKQLLTENKFLNYFFEYRCAMKVAIFLLAVCGVFNIFFFVLFILFEFAYLVAGSISENGLFKKSRI